MKTKLHVGLGAVLLAALCSFCTSHHKEESVAADEWKELDAFHMVMAELFHPLKDSGNVQPAMQRMGELADAAEKLAASQLPNKADNDEVKSMLEKLKKDTRSLADEIKDGAPEDQVGTTLYEIHDLFHKLMEAWHEEGEGEGHEKGH